MKGRLALASMARIDTALAVREALEPPHRAAPEQTELAAWGASRVAKKGQVFCVRTAAVTMPPYASMASRPLRSSFNCISSWPFASLGYRTRMPIECSLGLNTERVLPYMCNF